MSPQDFGLTLALFPSPPSTLPPSPRNNTITESNKSMALGSTTPAAPSSSRPELALYYFNSPTMLPHQKKPIPLMPSNTSNLVDVVMMAEDAEGKGLTEPGTPRKRERSPLPSDSEKGNKRKTPRKMRSSPFLAAATGHWFQAARSLSPSSLSAAVITAPGTSPKAADGTITGVRNGDTARATTLNASTSINNNVNSAEMETVKVISRAVRQRVAQSSSSSTAASAIAVDTAASGRSVEVECTSPSTSAPPIPPAPSSSSSKSPFKKRRRVEKTQRPSSPLRNPPISASDLPIASSSSSSSPAAAPSSPAKAKKPSKAKPTAWEKRPLLQKVMLKEFERTPHGAEILRRGAKAGIAFLEEQRRLLEATGGRENQSPKSAAGRKSTSSDEAVEVDGVIVKSRSKEVSSMRHWGRIVKTALAGPLKEMAGPMAGDGRPPMPMIRAW